MFLVPYRWASRLDWISAICRFCPTLGLAIAQLQLLSSCRGQCTYDATLIPANMTANLTTGAQVPNWIYPIVKLLSRCWLV